MVKAVLDYLEGWLEQNVLHVLQSAGDPLSRLQQMCDRVDQVYDHGQQPCMFAILLLGSARDVFHHQVNLLFRGWIEAIATVLVQAGLAQTLAQQRAEDGVIAIQGALILAQGLGDPAPFQRIIQQLPAYLLENEYPA